ncbi:MAG: LytTR family DNA-binding domain-containing protein [Bacteroidota bacterium]
MHDTPIQALIIEDEKPSAENLMTLLERYVPDVQVMDWADNVEDALLKLTEKKPHLVFLDIELGTSTAFDFLKRVGKVDFKIIFITAYEDYAIQAIKFNAMDYLLKPIDIEELKGAVEKVKKESEQDDKIERLLESFSNRQLKKLPIPTREGYLMVKIKDIMHIQSDGAYSKIYMEDGRMIHVSKNLKEFELTLDIHNFVRVHHSHLVNLEKVKKYVRGEGGYLVMENDETVDVSKRKKESLVSKLKER